MGFSESTVSIIVISTVIFSEFPAISVPSKTASKIPVVSKVFGLNDRLAMEQLSKLPSSTSATETVTEGLPAKSAVIFWPITVGEIVSKTVMIASQEAEFPAASNTVKITLLSPRSLQVKVLKFNSNEAIPTLSEEPPSMASAVTVTVPLSSSSTVIF